MYDRCIILCVLSMLLGCLEPHRAPVLDERIEDLGTDQTGDVRPYSGGNDGTVPIDATLSVMDTHVPVDMVVTKDASPSHDMAMRMDMSLNHDLGITLDATLTQDMNPILDASLSSDTRPRSDATLMVDSAPLDSGLVDFDAVVADGDVDAEVARLEDGSLVLDEGIGPPRIVLDEDGVRSWDDGSQRRTCKAYLDDPPADADEQGFVSGMYWIGTSSGPIRAYCDMETDGGGWTLLGHYRHPSNENGPEDLDARDYAYFMRARSDRAFGLAHHIGDPNSGGMWTDWRALGGSGWPIEFAAVLDRGPEFQPGWDRHAAKVIYRVKHRNVLPNYGTSQALSAGDQLAYRLSFADPWTDVGSQSSSRHYFWYPRDTQNRYLVLFHVSNYVYLDGQAPTNLQHSAFYGAGVTGGDNSWQHSAHLFFRELEPLPPLDGVRVVVGDDGVRRWSDGEPAATCLDYRRGRPNAYEPSILSGVYAVTYRNVDGNVYCDMETDGGGWTLVGHYRNPASENAPPGLDSRDYAYFIRARENQAFGVDAYIGNPDSPGAWTDWRPLEAIGFPLEFAHVLDQGQTFVPAWDSYPAKVIYRVERRDLMPNYGTEQDIAQDEGVMYKLNPAEPWIDLGERSASGTYYWYPRARDDRYLTLLHVSNYFYLDGRAATNYNHGAYYGEGTPGGDNSWHHGARFWVRQLAPEQ